MRHLLAHCLLGLALLMPLVATAQSIPVRIERLSPATVNIPVNTVYPKPFRYRVVRADTGTPIAGLEMYVYTEPFLCLPLLPCEFDAPGYFGAFTDDIAPVSDAQGVIERPGFRAGWGPHPYEILAWMPPTPGYVLVDDAQRGITIRQISIRSIPSISPVVLGLLLLLTLRFAATRRSKADLL